MSCHATLTGNCLLLAGSRNSKVLVSSEEINGKWVKSGQGHIDGLFDIGESCSLIINTVSIADEGLYTVTVGEKTTGKVFVNLTNVVVYGK